MLISVEIISFNILKTKIYTQSTNKPTSGLKQCLWHEGLVRTCLGVLTEVLLALFTYESLLVSSHEKAVIMCA